MIVTRCVEFGANAKDDGEIVKKLPDAESVTSVAVPPTLVSAKRSVASPSDPLHHASEASEAEVRRLVSILTAATVTVAVAVALPPAPVAVSLYVVVCVGETVTFPEAFCVPTPLSIETDPALKVDHDSVDESPALIMDGLALKLRIAGPGVPVDERVIVNVIPSPENCPGTEPLIVLPLIVAVKAFPPLLGTKASGDGTAIDLPRKQNRLAPGIDDCAAAWRVANILLSVTDREGTADGCPGLDQTGSCGARVRDPGRVPAGDDDRVVRAGVRAG